MSLIFVEVAAECCTEHDWGHWYAPGAMGAAGRSLNKKNGRKKENSSLFGFDVFRRYKFAIIGT